MTTLQELWHKFDIEFLQALAHHYNEEDEVEYIEPLRRAILGQNAYQIYGFLITPHGAKGYIIHYHDYIGVASSKPDVITVVARFINSQPSWNGPTLHQFAEAWNRLGEVR